MNHTTSLKIEKFLDKTLIEPIAIWKKMLLEGDLQNYEKELNKSLIDVHNFISENLLPLCSRELFEKIKKDGKKAGVKKVEERPMPIRLSTGHEIKVPSLYAKEVKNDWTGSRYLLTKHWGIIKGSSPFLYDKVVYCAALCPSYDFAHQVLMKFGTTMCLSSVRDITNRLAEHVFAFGEENLMLKKKETVAGKRVVIAIDGGRTRTRIYHGEINESGHAKYEAAWKEPKLFVIDVLDEKGQPSRYKLPIYGCRFAEEAVLGLLKSYLEKLEISKAKQVQILADGAPWIWNRIKPMLRSLKVKSSRIIETLDYYHASGYVHDLVEHMPGKINKKYKTAYLKQFKEWLWHGKTKEIVRVCKSIYKRPSQIINRWMEYLNKHDKKTQYATFEADKLMCGSGIIESGIRRIINLRFKNASTFWKIETVEKLYFFRAALLSKRWDVVMNNLANTT